MASRDELIGADRVADLEHRQEAGSHVGVTEPKQWRLAPKRLPGPGARKAVGLLFRDDRGKEVVECPDPGLDRMSVLVGQHDPHHRRSVGVGERRQQAVAPVAVVVRHEVSEFAIERDVQLQVGVGGRTFAATGDRGGALGVPGVHASVERLVGLAVDLRVDLAPPPFDVGEGHCDEGVMVAGRFVVAGVDDIGEGYVDEDLRLDDRGQCRRRRTTFGRVVGWRRGR